MTPGPRFAAATAAVAVLALVAAAQAQERSPAERQGLVDLARVLGESHALRQACEGPRDQFWRSRMQRLLAVEAADQGLKTRISVAFNAGYGSGRSLFPKCTDAAQAEARRIAGDGQKLSLKLALP